MEFRILGPIEARENDRLLPVRGGKQKALLALLLLNANHVVSSGLLVDQLWPQEAPDSGLNALQVRLSHLRRSLQVAGAPGPIVTRAPGYVLQVDPDDLDLLRFERLVSQARGALAKNDPSAAADRFRRALTLWRGPPLADLEHENFLQAAVVRLQELRMSALEQRIDADLALLRHADVIGELEGLVGEHPLRERLQRQLMLALYRSGRQAEALQSYRAAREALVDHVGIEPGAALRELEGAILRQDPALDLPRALPGALPRAMPTPGAAGEPPERSILVVALEDDDVEPLLDVAEPLAMRPRRELLLVRLIGKGEDLPAACGLVAARRSALRARGVYVRATAFISANAGADVVRLSLDEVVDLVLVGAPAELVVTGLPTQELRTILECAPCDVAVLAPAAARHAATGPTGAVLVPFGGGEHDWAAIEVAAWVAKAQNVPLWLLGTDADPRAGTRDASRLLARASLVVQRAADVVAEPRLVPSGADGILEAAAWGTLLVLGLSTSKRESGLGQVRHELLRRAHVPLLLVRKGVRPGGLAPSESLTRFTWSLTQVRDGAATSPPPGDRG